MKRFEHLLLPLVALMLMSCQEGTGQMEYFHESGSRFHTLYNITYEAPELLTEQIDSTMTAFNASLNPFDSTTLISRINRNETVVMDEMLRTVVAKSLEVSRATEGRYDITGAPYFDVWGFGTKKGVTRQATEAELDSIATFVGWQKLALQGDSLIKADPRMTLNPSSLSKGYVVDLVATTLERYGVTNYLVEIGGEIVAKGVNPDGHCWRVGINKPTEDSTSTISELAYSVELCDGEGMASSGDYRNFKVVEGKKVAHTIDVLSGRPAHQDILSATVVAPTCMEADAWATALMAVGLERGKQLLEQQPQLKVCLIYSDHATGALKTYNNGLELHEIK